MRNFNDFYEIASQRLSKFLFDIVKCNKIYKLGLLLTIMVTAYDDLREGLAAELYRDSQGNCYEICFDVIRDNKMPFSKNWSELVYLTLEEIAHLKRVKSPKLLKIP